MENQYMQRIRFVNRNKRVTKSGYNLCNHLICRSNLLNTNNNRIKYNKRAHMHTCIHKR